MPPLSALSIKRGDTFSFAGYLPVGALPEGVWTARCSLLNRASNVTRPIAAILTPPTEIEPRWMLHLYAAATTTANWTPGKYVGDVEFTDSSAAPIPHTVSSRDFAVTVLPDRTLS